MRYASIRDMDISNGQGLGVSLFVQGCYFHCKNCFNSETWDFNGGKEWTTEIKEKFLKLIDRDYIERVTILGGEPLVDQNVESVLDLVKEIREKFPKKKIWIYTGYKWNAILYPVVTDDFNLERDRILQIRRDILNYIDVLVDEKFEDDKKDLTLKWKGSSNQHVIDVKRSLEESKIIEIEGGQSNEKKRNN